MQSTVEILTEITALNARFAWLVDHHGGVGVPELFEEDGIYGYVDGGKLVGREAIEDFYIQRRARAHRKSRHVFTNTVLTDVHAPEVRGITILTLFAYEHPVESNPLPILVSDYHDRYIWSEESGWRYRSRLVAPVFGKPPQLPGKFT